jgi:hypothetical protein
MASPTTITVRVDDWTLRCLFNRAHLYERGKAKEFDVIETKKPRVPTPDYPYPFSALCYYMDRDANVEVARTHHFIRADGLTIGASGMPDPKRLYLGGTHYKQMKGLDILRDPSKRFRPGSFPHRSYVLWRRLKCFLLGR